MSAPFVNDEKTSTPQQMCSSFLYRQIEDIPGVYSLMDQLKNGVVAMETEDTNSELFSIGGFSIRRGIIVVIISYPHFLMFISSCTGTNHFNLEFFGRTIFLQAFI